MPRSSPVGFDLQPRTDPARYYGRQSIVWHAATRRERGALAGDLAAEQARTEKAIDAFASLAERLDALAAERARPWWRRLVARS
jgi:hypothetical protein